MWLFNFFRVGGIIAKKINHGGHGGHRELLFSLCPLWFSKTQLPRDNKKSHAPLRSEMEPITRKSIDNFSGSYVSQLAIIDRHQAVTITLGSEKIRTSFSGASGMGSPSSISSSVISSTTSLIFFNDSSLVYPHVAPPISSRAGQ